ncbi:MAG: glycolate oxidase subunit GlcF [Gammaproteobacteria bacterium]
MQTRIDDSIKHTGEGRLAEAILRNCVHCGFCNAVCPSYQLFGDELDGPRGRIYLIKQVLEGNQATAAAQLHLDRCLSCRACETACPSGVQYGRLLDIGREVVDSQVIRPWSQRFIRRLMCLVLPYPKRLAKLLMIVQSVAFLLPLRLREKLRPPDISINRLQASHDRRMLILEGCVQSNLRPNINRAAADILGRLGIGLVDVEAAGCCGALPYHLNDRSAGLEMMRRLIDAWWPHVENGIEAIVVTASGCGLMIQDFAELLKDDPEYAEKAAKVTGLARDAVQVLENEDLSVLKVVPSRVALHVPCTLQNGLGLNGNVERLLTKMGFTLTTVTEAHLCCGSAGTYSILQPQIADRLRQRKLSALQAEQPECIVTANIGCQLYLGEQAAVPVVHWIELLSLCRNEGS